MVVVPVVPVVPAVLVVLTRVIRGFGERGGGDAKAHPRRHGRASDNDEHAAPTMSCG
jgi:hypothetical protein